MAKKNYFDFSVFDEIGDTMDLFSNTIRNAFEFDALAGKQIFNAIVLTQPIPMNDKQIAAFITEKQPKINTLLFTNDSDIENAIGNAIKSWDDIPRFTFKARIIGPNSPHLFLPDPCNQETAKEIQQQQNIQNVIDMHTTVIANNATERPEIGNIVKIRIDQGTFTINPQTAEFVEVVTGFPTAINNLLRLQEDSAECAETLQNLFNNSYSGASVSSIQVNRIMAIYKGRVPHIEVQNGALREAGIALQAAESGLYNPRRNTPKFIPQVTAQFNELAKKYKQDTGEVLSIASSYRDFNSQVRMKIDKINEGKPSNAATPGESNHGWGVAFDVDGTLILEDGSTIPDNDPNKKYRRFESKIYKWLKANAGDFGFKNPSKLGPKSNTPEAWHWENIEIRDKLYDFKKSIPGYVNADGVEIDPEDMKS